LLITGWLQE